MSDLLSIAASGLKAYQTALTTVSENISNAGTVGYARRTATLNEVATAGGKNSTLNGMGVAVNGIARATDPYTEISLRNSGADLSRTQASQVWLERIESALGGANLAGQMTSFFAAGTALAAEPTSTALRAGMMTSAGSVADAFNTTARALDQAGDELDSRATQATSELTRLNQALLKVNQGLGRTNAGTAAAAQLSDQRDQVLEQMSAITDVTVTFDTVGRATVRAGGATGALLVDAVEASDVNYARSGGAVALSVSRSEGISALIPAGGALAGMVEGAQRLQDTTDALNDVAGDFVAKVNTLQTNGENLTGAAGKAMFTVTMPASGLAVASGFTPNDIAAASVGGGSRDATNLTALASLRQSGGYEARIQALVTDNASALKQRQLVSDAQTAIHDGAVTARSEVSGVNLDAEAVDLIRFQQAYQASSRVIQVARETFQSLIQIG